MQDERAQQNEWGRRTLRRSRYQTDETRAKRYCSSEAPGGNTQQERVSYGRASPYRGRLKQNREVFSGNGDTISVVSTSRRGYESQMTKYSVELSRGTYPRILIFEKRWLISVIRSMRKQINGTIFVQSQENNSLSTTRITYRTIHETRISFKLSLLRTSLPEEIEPVALKQQP